MRNKFDEQLELLNVKMVEMGAMTEEIISLVSRALVDKDSSLVASVFDLEDKIDIAEKDIESLCMKLLLQQQPVARDLRTISSALKILTDLERISDQACDISTLCTYLVKENYIKELVHIPMMAEATIKMVTDCMEAFVKKDESLARAVIEYDDVVDDLYYTIKDDLIDLIAKDPNNGRQGLDLLMIAKHFERIGDHAVNIAGWVLFSITGLHKNERIL